MAPCLIVQGARLRCAFTSVVPSPRPEATVDERSSCLGGESAFSHRSFYKFASFLLYGHLAPTVSCYPSPAAIDRTPFDFPVLRR